MNIKRNKAYERVMSRVNNRSRTSLSSGSNVIRHVIPSSVQVGIKPAASNVNSGVELPTVLNEYSPETNRENRKRSNVVKPKRTLKSLDPAKSPPRVTSRPREFSEKPRNIRVPGSMPSVVTRGGDGWSDSHLRQCFSSRSHTRLKELRDEIKAYDKTEKLLRLRSGLYKRCGVVLDDVGQVAVDKAVQAEVPDTVNENNGMRCRQWLHLIGRSDLESKKIDTLYSSYCVCDLHFVESEVLTKKLLSTALPTLQLPQMNTPHNSKQTQTDLDIQPSFCGDVIPRPSTSVSISLVTIATQTPPVVSESTPRKRQLSLQLKTECKKRKLLRSQVETICIENVSETSQLQQIINIQKALKSESTGNRYDWEYIMFALNLYFASPLAYNVLSKNLGLPSVKTLQRQNIDVSTKLSDNVVKCLESKVRNLSESEKYCIICADEMSLKRHVHYQINKDKIVGLHEINEIQTNEIATQALVLMAQGVFSDWKQPLVFSFLSQNKNYAELNTWLDEIIAKMSDIGFNVVAFTSTQGSHFISIANTKKVSVENPFFNVKGKKIYYIFDVPHLMKSFRNSLINFHFVYHDTDDSELVACWDDIETVYDIESNKTYKMAYKLTESHIRPSNSEKMRVKYATQVLSRSVAVALSTLIESGKLCHKSWGTVKLVEMMNDAFDILNSSTVSSTYEYKKAFSSKEYQITTLDRVQHMLSDLRVVKERNGKDMTKAMKFIKGLLISIKSILSLASDLKDVGFNFLFTRRLNLDAMENFFGAVRKRCGNCREPTAIQFVAAFRKLFIVNIIRHSKYRNCSEDLDKLLLSAKEAKSLLTGNENSTEISRNVLEVGTIDYRFEPPKEDAFGYVCGYLLKKCKYIHKNCEAMKNYVKKSEQVDNTVVFTYYKTCKSDSTFGSLKNPPEHFKEYIKKLDNICENHFKNDSFYHVGNEIVRKFDSIEFHLPCTCFPLLYLKKIFVRFRIFNLMRHNNKILRNISFGRKFFSVCNL